MVFFTETRIATASIAILLISLFSLTPRVACAFPDEILEQMRQGVSEQAEKYSAIRAELELIDPTQWTIEQHSEYLNVALWTIYKGLSYYFMQNVSLPADLSSLAGTTYIPLWPANPYNGWQPIRMVQVSDDFFPGDVILQICPPEFYSYLKNTRPASCELSINGPTLEFGEMFSPEPLAENTWAVIPEGTVYILGQFAETAAETRAKIERYHQGGDQK